MGVYLSLCGTTSLWDIWQMVQHAADETASRRMALCWLAAA